MTDDEIRSFVKRENGNYGRAIRFFSERYPEEMDRVYKIVAELRGKNL